MSGFKGSYYIPIPCGLHAAFEDSGLIPFSAAVGRPFFFAWRKTLGAKQGRAEVSKADSLRPRTKKPARRA